MKSIAFAAVLLTALFGSLQGARCERKALAGLAKVIDGDTVEVAGKRVRLKGVDAPELKMPGGKYALEVLSDIVDPFGFLICHLTGEKAHGREVGYCYLPNDVDINREVIRSGAALACPRYSDRYIPDETIEARRTMSRAPYCM